EAVNKPGRLTIQENKAELEVDEIEGNSPVGAITGLNPAQNSAAPEKESELPEASNGELQAVMKFMNSMENEFGISARELVSAMAMMADQSAQNQNAQTPILGSANSLSQSQVFQKLGLEGGQIRRAEYLYQSML